MRQTQDSVIKEIEESKAMSEDIEEMKNTVKIGLALDKVLESNIEVINGESWSGYTQFADKNRTLFSIVRVFQSDVQSHQSRTIALASTAATFNAASGSGLSGAFTSFSTIPNQTVQTELKKIFIDTIDSELESIRADLISKFPHLLSDFNKVVRDWRSMPDTEKYKVLIEIRSIIVDRLMDVLCPIKGSGSFYCKVSWCQPGIKGRIFQAKFFMIGFSDVRVLPTSTLGIIDKIATDFQFCFDELSNKGKTKAFGYETDKLFRNVISWFHQALIHHKAFFKQTP